MKGRTVYRNSNTGIEVTVSKPAEQLIGRLVIGEFVRLLTELLEILGAKWAMVSKYGPSVMVHIEGPGDRHDHWKIPVKR